MAASTALDALFSRPIAHRGLHDPSAGRFENTLSAARAAVAGGYAIECDVQRSADGEAMVFHDASLERLTARTGAVAALSSLALAHVAVGATSDRIPTLGSLLDAIAGAVPLICEIKSDFDGDMRLTDRVIEVLKTYRGPVALKSFDPAVLVHLRTARPSKIPIGIVAESRYGDPEWSFLSEGSKAALSALTHFPDTNPDFLSYWVEELPHAAVTLFRVALRRPVVTWTVRSPLQRERAGRWADQMVFEGFTP